MAETLTLQVAIPTHTPQGLERIEKLLLPPQQGVGYVVSWQDHRGSEIPASLISRNDVAIFRFDGGGLSANRNNAVEHCQADIVLIGDDDLIYLPGAFDEIKEIFEADPALEYASFKYDSPDQKPYPNCETSINPAPKGFYQTTFEVAFRRSGRASKLRFSQLFGPGAPFLTAGEDEFFLLTANKMGLNCRFFPIIIARHPTLTSGALPKSSDGLLRTTGAIIALRHRTMWIPRVAVVAIRISREGKAGLFKALKTMTDGALYALRNFHSDFTAEADGC